VAVALAAGAGAPAVAQELAPAAVAAPAPAADLAAYVEGMVETAMKTERIAGVSVAVVRNGETLLLKGWGVADAKGRPVDPARTLFRIASISKTFTYIALMQQVEAGRVDLEKPANDYLPQALRIPDDGFAAPVRVRHLLTHTAGFEDLVAGHLFVADPAKALPLADALAQHRPKRVRPPGVAAVYSNYGVALIGAIVQQVSGLSFEDYVEQRVLAPFGLQNTTFREPYSPGLVQGRGLPSPMSPALAADLADGFRWQGGAHVRQPFEYTVQFAPAASASATAADMARYMTALLAGGAGVVSPRTAALFASPVPLFANAPGVNGVAYGMLQGHSEGGWRYWGHGGDTLRFHSELALFPDLGLGVFVTTNSVSGGALRDVLPGRIADRLAGANPAPRPSPVALSHAALRRFAGAYLVDRRAYSNAERPFCLVRCTLTVTAPVAAGELVLASGGATSRLAPLGVRERGPGVRLHLFRNTESGETAAFEERDGRIVRYISAGGVNRATRVSAFAAPQGFFAVAGLGLVAALAALLSGLSRLLSAPQPHAAARAAGLLTPLAGAAWLVALGAFGVYFQRASADDWTVFADWPGAMRTGAIAAIVAAALTALAAIAAALAWRKADWSVWRRTRILATLGALAALGGMLHFWNMIGLRF
jgi:CubicO group peptidase (beta-lactamase class C family)